MEMEGEECGERRKKPYLLVEMVSVYVGTILHFL